TRQGIPMITAAVATGGELRWANGYGLSDVENNVPAKAATVHRLGSISKPITAVAALQLYESGRLDLDAPVQKYVPGFPLKPWPITSRQLLGHLGGIRHYNGEDEVNSTRHYRNLIDPLAIFQRDALVAEPGTRYNYTTYGYVLLGAVVEAASGARFMDYLRERVFLPAAMDRIRDDHPFALIPNRARGYRRYATGQLENCALADTSNKIPGGGLCSTTEDLVKFALAVRRGTLLKPETVEMMFTRQKLRDGTETPYGLGWNVPAVEGGRRIVMHGGGQQGTSTVLAMLPREGAAVALMCNLERGSLSKLGVEMLRQVTQ
ncbi:MAG: serine hydrolase domain-containing protein, partial [Bryobacteraceae bacterium]